MHTHACAADRPIDAYRLADAPSHCQNQSTVRASGRSAHSTRLRMPVSVGRCASVCTAATRACIRARTQTCAHTRAHTRAHAHRPKHVRHIVYSREVRADGKRSEPIRLSVFRKTSLSNDCPQGLYLHRKEPLKHVLLMDVLAISSCQLYSHSAQLSAARRWPSERESAAMHTSECYALTSY
jgi:hypothetical protein